MSLVPINQNDVLNFAAELGTGSNPVTAGAWVDILSLVNGYDLTASGEDAETDRIAKIFLAAHLGKMLQLAKGKAAGPVTSESVGGIRRSYGLPMMLNESALTTTRYGQLYLGVLRSSLVALPLPC